jgi:hypothetical protein
MAITTEIRSIRNPPIIVGESINARPKEYYTKSRSWRQYANALAYQNIIALKSKMHVGKNSPRMTHVICDPDKKKTARRRSLIKSWGSGFYATLNAILL